MKVGVISDTHGYLDPKVLELFRGVEHIFHAGDIGTSMIPFELSEIAPVTAVLGNTDPPLPFKETEVQVVGGRKFLVHHIVKHPLELGESLQRRVTREKPDVIVFGHTHKPFSEVHNGILFFNPGYAGKPRFKLERSVALLEWKDGKLQEKFLPL
ncbi:MAG: metallophosphoesterase family protein [Verrucomicrobiota bacterium]